MLTIAGTVNSNRKVLYTASDSVPDHAKRFFVAHLARGPKNAEGLASILEGFFRRGLAGRLTRSSYL